MSEDSAVSGTGRKGRVGWEATDGREFSKQVKRKVRAEGKKKKKRKKRYVTRSHSLRVSLVIAQTKHPTK